MFVASLFSGCANTDLRREASLKSFVPEIILSTNHQTFSRHHQPSTLKIGSDTLYAITKWVDLEGRLIDYLCKIYDGEGKLAFSMGGRILPDQPVYYYQSNYGPHPVIDKAGVWFIEIYANNVLVSTREIKAIK